MDMALNYVGLAATMGLSAYVLAQLLLGGSANRQLYHGMNGQWLLVLQQESDQW